MIKITDGRSELWQWDTGRSVTVPAECTEVHFSNKILGRSIDVEVVGGVASVPDALLQTDKDLAVWAFVGTPENGYTKISKIFKVNRRNRPAEYVFTPSEQITLQDLIDRVEELEESGGGGVTSEEVQMMVNEALRQAKESGEFKGEKGDKGDPYTLTAEDKNEIVTEVLQALPNGDEVSY